MIGSFLTRGLVLALGYAYPAYECYKTVEKNRPEIDHLRFWCQYWILVAVLTVCERIGDAFISWVPMYSEAKLAFFIYLWYPKTKGTTYVYDSFFRPYVSKHENDIDRNLLELRTRAGDIAVLYCQRAVNYGQTRVLDVLQYIASQSTPNPRPPPTRRPSSTPKVPAKPEEPPSPTSSTSSSQDQKEVVEAGAPKAAPSAFATAAPKAAPSSASAPAAPKAAPSASAPAEPKAVPSASAPAALRAAPSASALGAPQGVTSNESSSQPVLSEQGVDPTETEPPATDDAIHRHNADPPEEILMEETPHRTRSRLRRARAASIIKRTDSAAPS